MNTKTLLGVGVGIAVILSGIAIFLTLNTNRWFGAVPTLDGVDSGYVTINGLKQFYQTQAITATSSAFCRMKNPFNASSTVNTLSSVITTGILGANTFDVSTTTNALPYASSSKPFILAHSVASGLGDTLLWSGGATTTNANILPPFDNSTGESLVVIKPSEWITWRIATGTPGTFSTYFTGTCSALWQKI